MATGETLGLRPIRGTDRERLTGVFEWFVGLALPYETVSNQLWNVHIKTAEQMVEAVTDGFGGHCVEHAVLLTAILAEQGFDARFVNADVHDLARGVRIELAKPMVYVRLGDQTFLCDPYYGRTLLRVPRRGELRSGRRVVRRLDDDDTVVVLSRRGGRAVGKDVVRTYSTIDDRRRLFRERYATFSPFGVTAPYYQLLRPVRRALYYEPEADRLLTHDGCSARYLSDDQLAHVGWIPEKLRALIPVAVERNRRERVAAAAFLRTGAYRPYYRTLGRPAEPDTTRHSTGGQLR
jgi:hypothetical protein